MAGLSFNKVIGAKERFLFAQMGAAYVKVFPQKAD